MTSPGILARRHPLSAGLDRRPVDTLFLSRIKRPAQPPRMSFQSMVFFPLIYFPNVATEAASGMVGSFCSVVLEKPIDFCDVLPDREFANLKLEDCPGITERQLVVTVVEEFKGTVVAAQVRARLLCQSISTELRKGYWVVGFFGNPYLSKMG